MRSAASTPLLKAQASWARMSAEAEEDEDVDLDEETQQTGVAKFLLLRDVDDLLDKVDGLSSGAEGVTCTPMGLSPTGS